MTEGDFEVVDSSVEWEGKLSTMRVDQVRMPDGDTAAREVAEHIDAVAVVALTADDEVVLVRQYRHPLRLHQMELPAGILDVEGEAPEAAVARELAEETGMKVDGLQPIMRFANSAGWTDEHTTVFVGQRARRGERPDDFDPKAEEAAMEVLTMPFDEAVRRASSGEFTDAKTVIGILAVQARRVGGDENRRVHSSSD